MRSFQRDAAMYLAGALTLPALIWGLSALSQRSLAQNEPLFRDAEESVTPVRVPMPFDEADEKVFDPVHPAPVHPAPVLGPQCLPTVHIGMLALDVPDAAETESLGKLRETMKKVLEEKASLLNAKALEAEIAQQQRQITELKALQELQRLERSLTELGDKYPDSDAGKRAKTVLELLKSRGGLQLFPTPDDSFRRAPSYHPRPGSPGNPAVPYEPSSREEQFGVDRVLPQKKPDRKSVV